MMVYGFKSTNVHCRIEMRRASVHRFKHNDTKAQRHNAASPQPKVGRGGSGLLGISGMPGRLSIDPKVPNRPESSVEKSA